MNTATRKKVPMNNKLMNGLVAGSVAALVMGSANVANAFTVGPSNVVEEGGLSWLHMSVTDGVHIDEVSAALNGGALDGWRYATAYEVVSTWDESSVYERMGTTTEEDRSLNGIFGFIEEGDLIAYYSVKGKGKFKEWTRNKGNVGNQSLYASWLVRSTQKNPEAVPEPITGLVLAAAGGGAALRRAKNKKRSKQS